MSSQNVVDLRKRKAGAPSTQRQAPLPLRPQKRVSPVRVRRRNVRLLITSIVVVFAASCVLIVSYASYLPRYSIENVTVMGANAVSANLVVDYAESIIYDGSRHFFSRASSLLYPKSVIEKDIPMEFPRIASATVTASPLSNFITINITERQPFALWCNDGSCYELDQSGYIFTQASMNASTTGEYIFSGGVSTSSPVIGQTFVPGHTSGLVAFLQLLGESGFTPLGAQVQSDQDFIVPLSQGFSVYASFGEDPGALVSNLQLALSSGGLAGQEQNLDYIDLRFGDKVYYKLKGQPQEQTGSSSQ